MPVRTDTAAAPHLVAVPEARPKDDLQLGCAVCRRELPVKETVLFWRTDRGHFEVAHIDCVLPPARTVTG